MTDSYNQAISSTWIGKRVYVKKEERELYGTIQYFGEIITTDGKWCGIELDESFGENDGMIHNERYFVCKDKHGIFVPLFETKQLTCEIIKIFPNNFSCDFGSQKPLNSNEEQHFSLNLSVENNSKREIITNSHLDSPVNVGLNKTFDVSIRNDGRKKISHENQMSGAVLDKTIKLSTLKSKCLHEKHASTRFDSEESLGIIPDVLDFNATWDLLNSGSIFFNDFSRENCMAEAHDIPISEVLSPQNLDCCDLKKLCFVDSPVQSCVMEAIYTSTPKHPMKSIKLDASTIVPQNQHPFLLQDKVKVDEPILAGSSQTVSKIYFDVEEFDKSKILSSTSKVSSLLQIHHDLLTKTSNLNDESLNLKSKDVSYACNYENNLSTRQTFSEKPLEINNGFEKLEDSRALYHTNVLNTTFEVKPTMSSTSVSSDKSKLDASPFLATNCININKTISKHNLTTVIEDDTIRNSDCEVIHPFLATNCININKTISKHNLTTVIEDDTIRNSDCEVISNEWSVSKILNSSNALNNQPLNASGIINENEKCHNMQLNQCSNSADETISLRRASLDSKNFSPRSACLSINSSVNSLETASENANLTFELNTTFFIKNGELQAKQSASEHLNKTCSLSAVPVLPNANFKLDIFKTPLPVSSKLDSLPKSEPSSSVSNTIDAEAKISKKFIKGAMSACLPKSVKANTYEKNDVSAGSYRSLNDLSLKGTAVKSKKLKVTEARSANRAAIQTKAGIKVLLDKPFIKNSDISKHSTSSQRENVKTYGSTFLNSHVETADNLNGKNRTFSASDEFHEESTADKEWGKCEIPDEVSDKSINDPTIQIEESPTDKPVTEVVNLTETKRDYFVTNFLDKNTLNIPHSYDRSLKDLSKKSTIEYENINSNVSLKCGVKGIFSKAINRPRLSFVPTLKSNVSGGLSSENKDTCTSMHTENEFHDSSRISSKQYSGKSIQVPRFCLKSSTGNVIEPVRSQEKALQKENIKLNSVPLGKNKKLDSIQSDNSRKFCQTGKVLKPITEKVSKVPTIAIPKKEYLDTVESKSDQSSRIPSFARCQQKLQLRKIQAPQSRHIRQTDIGVD